MSEIKAVILAAGVASRLRPLTNNIPKCMVRIYGKSLLEYQLDAYREANIKEIFIVVGYKANLIIDYCNKIKDLNITIIENKEYLTTNNMYSLYLVKNIIKNNAFILNNADLIIEKDIVKLMVQDKRSDLIMVDTEQYNNESMKICIDNNKNIIDISKEIPKNLAYGCSIDYYKFSKEFSILLFDKIEDIIEKEKVLTKWTEVAIQDLLKSKSLIMQPISIQGKQWLEIDDYTDLEISEKLFSSIRPDLSSIDMLFIDLDGTIYLDDKLIEGSDLFIQRMKEMGKKIYFVSNNSSKSKIQYVNKLKYLNINAVEEDIILSTDGLLNYLKEKDVKTVYVVGTKALCTQIKNCGINISDINPEYIVVGYDTELTYEKLATACILLKNEVEIIATHCDLVCPTSKGVIPDIGSILKIFEVAVGKTPMIVFGKPEASMISHLLSKHNIKHEKIAIIGDRLYTDMKLAENSGIKSILVLSGETQRIDVQNTNIHLDLLVPSLRHLL